jgi:hypothetical protein
MQVLKALGIVAAAVASIAGIFEGGKWLIGTTFVGKDAFAAHVAADSEHESTTTTEIRTFRAEMRESQLLNCMMAANGRQVQMQMCQRTIINRGNE